MNKLRKTLISGIIGNALENYDYILYANFALVISKNFFPASNLYNSLLLTFAVFATGFLMRPIGAIIFGHIGDKYGRKLSLSLSIILMSFPTSLIGILPSYDEIGILAPIFLVIIRLLQGISIGGETSGFMTYLMESIPNSKNKVLLGSVVVSSTAIGLFFGFFASFICNFYFQEVTWAWRIPFIISLPIGIVGIYIRLKLDESLEFQALKNKKLISHSPILELITNYKKNFLIICGLFVSISIPFYIFFGFLSTFLVGIINYNPLQVSIIYLASTLAFGCFSMFSGWLSDRYGAYRVLSRSLIIFAIMVFPIFVLIIGNSYFLSAIGCISFISLIAIYQGSVPYLILKIFPTKIRAIGTSLSFNLVSVFCGGLAPFFITYFIKITDNYSVILFYLLFSSMISLISVFAGKRAGLI